MLDALTFRSKPPGLGRVGLLVILLKRRSWSDQPNRKPRLASAPPTLALKPHRQAGAVCLQGISTGNLFSPAQA